VDQSHTFASVKDLEAINLARKGPKRKRKDSIQNNYVNKKANRSPSPGGEHLDAIDMDLYGSHQDDEEEDKTMREVNNNSGSKPEEDRDDDSVMDEDDLYMNVAPQVAPQSDELIDELNVSNLGGLGADSEPSIWCQIYLTDGSLTVCSFFACFQARGPLFRYLMLFILSDLLAAFFQGSILLPTF
jgi:hypothetical protein